MKKLMIIFGIMMLFILSTSMVSAEVFSATLDSAAGTSDSSINLQMQMINQPSDSGDSFIFDGMSQLYEPDYSMYFYYPSSDFYDSASGFSIDCFLDNGGMPPDTGDESDALDLSMHTQFCFWDEDAGVSYVVGVTDYMEFDYVEFDYEEVTEGSGSGSECDSSLSELPCYIPDYTELSLDGDVYIDAYTAMLSGNLITLNDGASVNGNDYTIYYTESESDAVNLFKFLLDGSVTNLNISIEIMNGAIVEPGNLFSMDGYMSNYFTSIEITDNSGSGQTTAFYEASADGTSTTFSDVIINDYSGTVIDFSHGGSSELTLEDFITYNSDGTDLNLDIMGSLYVDDSFLSGNGNIGSSSDIYLTYYNGNSMMTFDDSISDTGTFVWNDQISHGSSGDDQWFFVAGAGVFQSIVQIEFNGLSSHGSNYDLLISGSVDEQAYSARDNGADYITFQADSLDNWSIEVAATNTAPTIDSFSNQPLTLVEGENQIVTATVTDTEGDATTEWGYMAIPISGCSGLTCDLIADNFGVGTHTIEFSITDGEFTDFDSFTLTVEAANTAPVVDEMESDNNGAPFTTSETQTWTLEVTDIEGDALYKWYSGVNSLFLNEIAGETGISITLDGSDYAPNQYLIVGVAYDADYSSNQSRSFEVIPANTAPIINSVTPTDASFSDIESQLFTASVTDNDGDATTSWLVDDASDAPGCYDSETCSIDGSSWSVGTHTLNVYSDDGVFQVTDSVTFEITASNTEPVINSITPSDRVELSTSNTQQIFNSDVTDEDGDAVYSWKVGGIEVSTTETYTANWADIVPGIYVLELQVSDAEYNNTEDTVLEIRAKGGSGSFSIVDETPEIETNEDAITPDERPGFVNRFITNIGDFFKGIGNFFGGLF